MKIKFTVLFLALFCILQISAQTDEVSAFNAQISQFTKQQTIDWLNEKLKVNIQLGLGNTNLKIVSLDACNLIIRYRTVFVNIEEMLPTDIKNINQFGNFEYSAEKATMRYLDPENLNEEVYKSSSSESGIDLSTQDEDLISNIEFAMKHLAGYCNNTNFNTAKATQASTELNLALWTEEEFEQLSKMYELKFNTIFSSDALATMEVKAKDSDLYKTLLEEIEVNMDWKKTDKTVNKVSGTAFLLYEGSRQTAEIFLNEDKQFCYYNSVVLSSDFAATITELKENKFILKINKVGSKIEEQWEKDGVPYQIRVLYNEGEKAGSIALIAMSFLKKNKK